MSELTYSTRNVLKNSALSVVYKGAGMLLSLISAPLILECLGKEKYGVWTSLLSIISWIYYLDLGIGNGLRIRLSEALADKKKKAAEKYITVSYVLLSIISVVTLLIVFLVLQFVDLRSALKISGNITENVNTIFFVALAFVCINFVLSLVNNIFYAAQNSSAVSALTVIGQLFFVLGLWLYSLNGSKLILLVACVEGLSQLLKNIVGSVWAYAKYPDCRLKIEKPDFRYSKGIMSFGIQSFISSIAALVLNSTDNLIIIRFLGATSVTNYDFCYRYFSMISTVFAVIVVPLQSAYTMAYTKKDIDWITKNLKRALLALLVFSVGTFIACFVFRPFTIIWVNCVYCNVLYFNYDFTYVFNIYKWNWKDT